MWEGLWFYMTQTPVYLDVKVHIKSPLCNYTTGMGREEMSKTLTCWHYGEMQTHPVRTKLLLRAWCVWRSQKRDWATAKDSRTRELCALRDALEVDLRVAHGNPLRKPLLHNDRAHRWLQLWVPELVRKLLAPT